MGQSNHATFTHARRLAGYNWPLYVVACSGVVLGLIVACVPQWLWLDRVAGGALLWVRLAGAIFATVAAWYAVASFTAFHWMFDRSPLLAGLWLRDELPSPPKRWIQLSVCLEETTLPMEAVFPNVEGRTLDLYDPQVMTEPAVARAKQAKGDSGASATVSAIAVDDGWADLVVVTLAAHEVRDAVAREQLFRELRRITAPTGRVILIEHLRNPAAFLAFGPGLFHFLPRREWLRLCDRIGLKIESERDITPFVHVFRLRV
jgi:SAM-dependent methyltransferase